jgi:hypothetical protein
MLMALSLPYGAGVLASLAAAMPALAERRLRTVAPTKAPTALPIAVSVAQPAGVQTTGAAS